jgi:hypothetical protein
MCNLSAHFFLDHHRTICERFCLFSFVDSFQAIPPYIDKIENIRSDAEFVLLVEKEAAYMRVSRSLARAPPGV